MKTLFLTTKWITYLLVNLSISLIFNMKSFSESNSTELVALAEKGDLPAVTLAIEQGADIEQRDLRLRTPLMAATNANQIEVA